MKPERGRGRRWRPWDHILLTSSAWPRAVLNRSHLAPSTAGLSSGVRRGGPRTLSEWFTDAGCGGVNDQDLIDRCRAGDREAQRELFEQTSLRIYRLLLRMTGNPDDAEDLTQETYVKGFQRLDQFDGRSAVASWFYRIAVNEAFQFRRRQSRAKSKIKLLAQNGTQGTEGTASDLRLDLEDALANLPANDQAVLLLRYQEQLDYRTIAEVLDCAEGTVASRLNRARERLRGILRKNYG